MAQLRIQTQSALGPLTVEVIGPRGDRVGGRLTLSSLRRGATVDLMPGDYTVVATRPSGEQLIAPTTVGPNGGDAVVAMSGASPREFLTDAAGLGLTYAPKASAPDDYRVTTLASPFAANTAARSMSALLRKQYVPGRFDLSLGDDQLASTDSTVRSVDCRLTCWRLSQGRWQTCSAPVPRYSDDYLQLVVTERHSPLAIGLLRDDGFGPVVTVPPLWSGIVLTFIAAGVAMDDNADRETNPSAVRVPVAFAVPQNPGLADLLVGLNAPVLPNASVVWQEGRSGDPESALLQLANKFDDSAAAVLGALFLARFAPSKLPLGWLRNLNGILPEVADSWLLLAWTRATQGDGDYKWPMSIAEQLRRASACRCTYFNRTRIQLAKLALRFGPYPRARQDDVATPRRARPGDYLDFSADAGGLEAFWGYSPTRPGNEPSYPTKKPGGSVIRMREGKFVRPG